MHTNWVVPIVVLASLCVACDSSPQSKIKSQVPFNLVETPVGDVHFPTGCDAEAAPLVERGVALLHHMMYDEANLVFSMADDVDPDCALAYWGQAMTIIHPLWPDVPTAAQIERGAALVRKSLSLGGSTNRENGYLETTRAYFENSAELTEMERLRRFESAWKLLSDTHPDDLEARAFYSLALRAIADNGDKDLLLQKKAGLIAEAVLAENANHPGAHHYIIHAYDYPELAHKAVETADHYGEITPRVPHATHMMTHIYTRLGQWDKAIKWNTISADTAWALCVQTGEINLHYTHALDYLAYAYLQIGDDQAVLEILQTADQLQPPYSETNRDASAYAFAALPARFALERRDWEAAIRLRPRQPASFPWEDKHDAYVAITHFARAIAHARSGHPAKASADIDHLAAIRVRLAGENPYWAKQVEIQQAAARAWQLYASESYEDGLKEMRHAAGLESSTEKHAVTPGEVLPAGELYGDMLFDSAQFEAAMAAYQLALIRTPGRYNSLLGAARSARQIGDLDAARDYYGQLLAIAGSSQKHREPTREAQAFLASY